jgi:hypothetical protein
MKTKIKIQKPIEIHASLRYRCPDIDCNFDHWITINQAKTKKYKIVCDCGTVFFPKTISSIDIRYKKKKKVTASPSEEKINIIQNVISEELLVKSSRLMQGFGFTKKESDAMLSNFYKTNPVNDYKELVKNTLAIKGE